MDCCGLSIVIQPISNWMCEEKSMKIQCEPQLMDDDVIIFIIQMNKWIRMCQSKWKEKRKQKSQKLKYEQQTQKQ